MTLYLVGYTMVALFSGAMFVASVKASSIMDWFTVVMLALLWPIVLPVKLGTHVAKRLR